jgi:epoxyqueuosine reductase
MEQILSAVSLKESIKARAQSLGFSLSGFCSPTPLEHFQKYEEWIASGLNGGMNYLASDRHRLRRQDPHLLNPWVKTILVLGRPYSLNRNGTSENKGQVAGYVGREDYHLAFPKLLSPLVEFIKEQYPNSIQSQIYTDSSPILERELGNRAGLGWIGRNSCLISPKFGSSFLLAEIFLSEEIPPDQPFEKELCGTCHRCLDDCPTNCILPNRTLNARNCISTLTIENKGNIPQEFRSSISNHLFGCDVCQSVCPWNRFSTNQFGEEDPYSPDEMIEMLSFSTSQFKEHFAESAILRAKRQGWIRNICQVLENLRIESARSALMSVLIKDPDPLCREFAANALSQISSEKNL